MAHERIDPREQIPQTDFLDQQAPLDPQALTDAGAIDTPADADEADRLEQHTAVPGGDEDDYPHEADAARWA